MGLILAIPATAAFTFFRNRIDALAADIGQIIGDLAVLIERAEPAAVEDEPARPGRPA